MLSYFKIYIWIMIALVIAVTPSSFAKSIEEQFKDAENLIEIDQKCSFQVDTYTTYSEINNYTFSATKLHATAPRDVV